jgi:hypothetical protein
VDGLQGRVSNTSAGNGLQSPIVLFTKEYFPIFVLCLLVLIYIMRSLMICTPQIKKIEMGGKRSTYGGDETYIKGSGGEA